MRLIFAVASIVLVGCSAGLDGPPKDVLRSVVGTDAQAEHATEVLWLFREMLDVDGSRVDVLFVNTAEEQQAECLGYAACTRPLTNGYKVAVYWPEGREEQWQHAYSLAHELCHVYVLQSGMDRSGDPDHAFVECYQRPDAPWMYGPGEGYAWQIAHQREWGVQ